MIIKIFRISLGLIVIAFAISLAEFDTVASLDSFYAGKSLGKGLIAFLYTTIGHKATIILLIAFASYNILIHFAPVTAFFKRTVKQKEETDKK